MKRIYLIFAIFAMMATLLVSLSGCSAGPKCEKHSSVYHWKSTFNLNDAEIDFLKRHNVDRIYIKMFDVARDYNFLLGKYQIEPIATTQFLSPIPSDVEVVPVAYITIDALHSMHKREAEFATLIVERMLAMCRHNKCGDISELQLDCDWTGTTKHIYKALCAEAKKLLDEYNIDLSITVRLHQLSESAPKADRGVLMLYNTGALKNPQTRNSILDIADAKPYLKPTKYDLPLGYAYPAFGWGVKFKDDEFVAIVSNENESPLRNEIIRRERATAAEILEVKALVEKMLGAPASGNILYHLDESQLKNYTDEEIAQIYNF